MRARLKLFARASKKDSNAGSNALKYIRVRRYRRLQFRALLIWFHRGPCRDRALFLGNALESVSSCTRFSGFLTISSFGFNRLSSKLVGMFFRIVPMFVLKDFVPDCFVAQICASSGAQAHFGAYLRDEAIPNKIL